VNVRPNASICANWSTFIVLMTFRWESTLLKVWRIISEMMSLSTSVKHISSSKRKISMNNGLTCSYTMLSLVWAIQERIFVSLLLTFWTLLLNTMLRVFLMWLRRFLTSQMSPTGKSRPSVSNSLPLSWHVSRARVTYSLKKKVLSLPFRNNKQTPTVTARHSSKILMLSNRT